MNKLWVVRQWEPRTCLGVGMPAVASVSGRIQVVVARQQAGAALAAGVDPASPDADPVVETITAHFAGVLAQATATAIGVPVVALTGDDAACAEATEWDASIATVAVKYAHDRFAAQLRPDTEARQAIEETVTAAIAHRPTATVPSGPSTLTVRWQSASAPATLLGIPGVTATDSRTVRAEGELPFLYRLFGVWMRVAASLTNQPPYC